MDKIKTVEETATLDVKSMTKKSLQAVLSNMGLSIPFSGLKPAEQIKNQTFLCGMIYGLCTALDLPDIPVVIENERFNQVCLRLIDQGLKNHPKIFRNMIAMMQPNNAANENAEAPANE